MELGQVGPRWNSSCGINDNWHGTCVGNSNRLFKTDTFRSEWSYNVRNASCVLIYGVVKILRSDRADFTVLNQSCSGGHKRLVVAVPLALEQNHLVFHTRRVRELLCIFFAHAGHTCGHHKNLSCGATTSHQPHFGAT